MKITTRVSALLLVIALLMNLLGAAFAAQEGVPVADFDMSTYRKIVSAAVEAQDSETEAEFGDLEFLAGECGDNEFCRNVKYMLETLTTAQKRYDYMMKLASDPEGVDLEFTMAHYYLTEVHSSTKLLCTCQFPSFSPEYKVGLVVDAEGKVSNHAEDCPWNFKNLSIAEQYDLVSTNDAALKEQYKSVMGVAAEKLARVNVDTYTAGTESASVEITVPKEAFNGDYILNAEEIGLGESEVSALAEAGVSNVLASFDISFTSLQNENAELQPAEGKTVPLTFNVNTANVEGNVLRVYHLTKNADGSYTAEPVGEPVEIGKATGNLSITVQATSFSIYLIAEEIEVESNGVPTDIWDNYDSWVWADVRKIGFLDKSKDTINFLSLDYEKLYGVPADSCPDYLFLYEKADDFEGNTCVYSWDTFDQSFWQDTDAGYTQYIEAEYFTSVVDFSDLYATLACEDGAEISFYNAADSGAASVSVDGAALDGTEFKVEDIDHDGDYNWFVKLVADENWPVDAAYCWVSSDNIADLSTEGTPGGDIPSDEDISSEDGSVKLAVDVPAGIFGEGIEHIMEAIEEKLSAEKIDALNRAMAGHTLAAFDIAFYDRNNPDTKLQPVNGTIPLTFTIDVSKVDGDVLQAYHVYEENGQYIAEAVGAQIAVDKTNATQEVTINASAFSTYVIGSLCDGSGDCFYNEFIQKSGFERAQILLELLNNEGETSFFSDYLYSQYDEFVGHIESYHKDCMAVCLCMDYKNSPETHGYGALGHSLNAPNFYFQNVVCPWHFSQLTVEDQYIVVKDMTEQEREQYMTDARLTNAQKAALNTYVAETCVVVGDKLMCGGVELANITEHGYVVDIATGIAVGIYDRETDTITLGTGN